MKKIGYQGIVFFLVTLFVLFSAANRDMLTAWQEAFAAQTDGGVDAFTDALEQKTAETLCYHGEWLIGLQSIKENLLGTRVIFKDDTTVVKADSGRLIAEVKAVPDEDIEQIASQVAAFQTTAEQNGAAFLYVAAPQKECYETAPPNIENAAKDNMERLQAALTERSVPYLDMAAVLDSQGAEDLFYVTDHHWKTSTGLTAAGAIGERLQELYGFDFDADSASIDNYKVETYPAWFLGSKGKKVGRFFTVPFADDFDLITPAFETDMVEEQPQKGESKEGRFEDTVLDLSNLTKDYYKVNTYATYSGGDFRLQIMKNRLRPDGRKILLVRDSFACVVAPFLSLQTSELHVCDIREMPGFGGQRLDLEAYIREIHPDYVVVLYNGVSPLDDSQNKYDFLP
ncbi:MAG: hypothetical protein IJU16_05460 [Clostridia bacterium]|nr:hypothetical protein [Clostridia bacterium]